MPHRQENLGSILWGRMSGGALGSVRNRFAVTRSTHGRLTTVVARIVADAGPEAARRFVEFFTATIRKMNDEWAEFDKRLEAEPEPSEAERDKMLGRLDEIEYEIDETVRGKRCHPTE